MFRQSANKLKLVLSEVEVKVDRSQRIRQFARPSPHLPQSQRSGAPSIALPKHPLPKSRKYNGDFIFICRPGLDKMRSESYNFLTNKRKQL